MAGMGRFRYFATTAKGFEGVLAEEVAGLGGREISAAVGGVSFTGDTALGYRAGLWLRTANRVLLHLSDFPAPSPGDLYAGVREIPWPDLFSRDKTFAVDATVRDSMIAHARFAEQKAKDAVADAFREKAGGRPDVDLRAPHVRINVRIYRDTCTLSLDLSGETLSHRGYRIDPADAPLRETVAAGIVLLSGWDRRVPFCDPVCGSGTIPIEAALLAANVAPGLIRRSFGFMHLSGFDRALWQRLRADGESSRVREALPRIAGSDRSEPAIRRAIRHARRASVASHVSFSVRDIGTFAPGDPPGIIVCNPPYGVRMGKDADIAAIYRAMGEAFKKRCRGWTAYVLSGNPEATRHIGLKASRRHPLMNGPIDCRLLKYELY